MRAHRSWWLLPGALILFSCASSCDEAPSDQPGNTNNLQVPDGALDAESLPDVDDFPDATIDAADTGPNPYVIELPPTGQNEITGIANWGYYVTYAEDRGDPINYRDVYYFDILSQAEYQVTSRVSAQIGPYGYNDEIVFQDHQFAIQDHRVELYLYNINTGIETRLTNDSAHKAVPMMNQGYIIYYSNEGCADVAYYNLSLMNRQTGEATVVSECDQSPESVSISEHFAAWSAQPQPGSGKDIFYRDLLAGVTFHIESTGPALQLITSTDDDHVVWQDQRDGQREVYMYTISTGVEECLTPDVWEQSIPRLRDGILSWCDLRHSQEWGYSGRCDIYVYELATGVERRVTSESRVWRPGFVDSGWIVYWDRLAGDKYKIYAHDLVGDGILTPDGHVIP